MLDKQDIRLIAIGQSSQLTSRHDYVLKVIHLETSSDYQHMYSVNGSHLVLSSSCIPRVSQRVSFAVVV
jgi:hypothetical protein